MKVINSERQESSVAPFRDLMFFDELSVDIKSDDNFMKDWGQSHSVGGQKARSRSFETVSSIQLLKTQQDEIQKLKNKILRLEDEKSILVKWVEYLF